MRAVVQRVLKSKVSVDDEIISTIDRGLLVFLGVSENDLIKDAQYLSDKIVNLRIFEDNEGKMNLSLKDVLGEMQVVSQFTLYGDCRKGKRPSFIEAARPEKAKELYDYFVILCSKESIIIKEGIFQAEMLVEIYNDGPVTIILDSNKSF
jgi:D-tyrosyl-tRNA(Tyr) deacylase